jgi:biotin transporter BioY
LLAAGLFGSHVGSLSMAVYLLALLLEVPVISSERTSSSRRTLWYVVGFIVAAFLIGDRIVLEGSVSIEDVFVLFMLAVVAHLIILAIAAVGIFLFDHSQPHTVKQIVDWYVTPYLIPALFKSAIFAVTFPIIKSLLSKSQQQ